MVGIRLTVSIRRVWYQKMILQPAPTCPSPSSSSSCRSLLPELSLHCPAGSSAFLGTWNQFNSLTQKKKLFKKCLNFFFKKSSIFWVSSYFSCFSELTHYSSVSQCQQGECDWRKPCSCCGYGQLFWLWPPHDTSTVAWQFPLTDTGQHGQVIAGTSKTWKKLINSTSELLGIDCSQIKSSIMKSHKDVAQQVLKQNS